jgi:hypothetical protein
MPYIRLVNRRVICAIVALTAAHARADGIAIVGGSPRAIGRAGAAVVGDDGGGALLINPATIARRDTTRGQIGIAVVEDSVEWQSTTQAAPLSTGQAGSRLAPIGAVVAAVGPWIVGGGMMTAGVSDRALARPGDVGAISAGYDYRYAGIAGGYRRDTMTIGAARRLGSSVALGLSLGLSRVTAAEHRCVWAGFGGRGLELIGKPESDIDLALRGTDRFVPSAVAGVLYAPEDMPIELGASVAWTDDARLDGTIDADGNPPDGPDILPTMAPHASLTVHQPVAVRAGGRYIADRFVAELGGDLWIARAAAGSAAWEVDGIRVIDPSNISVDLLRVPSRISQRTHAALRAAADIELIPGFLWAITGYSFSMLGTPPARLSPSFGDFGGHTFGVGLEASAGGFTVTIGWSRMWTRRMREPTVLQLDNPFIAAGDRPVYHGTYDAALDQVGILLEAELGHVAQLMPR